MCVCCIRSVVQGELWYHQSIHCLLVSNFVLLIGSSTVKDVLTVETGEEGYIYKKITDVYTHHPKVEKHNIRVPDSKAVFILQ